MKAIAIVATATLSLCACGEQPAMQRPAGAIERMNDDRNTDYRHDFGHCESDDSRGDRYDCHQDRHG